MPDTNLIEQAIQALQAGDRQRAQGLLTQRLAAEPKDGQAWQWLAECLSDNEKKRYCLERALALQPENAQAHQALAQLAATPPEVSQPSEALEPASPSAEEVLHPEAGAPAVEEPISGAPAPKAIASPPPQKRPGFSRAQTFLIILLAILMFVAVGALVLIVLQSQVFGSPAGPSQPAQAPMSKAPLTYFEFPATWTPTPSQAAILPEPPKTLPPTAGVFQTPLPSLTPISSERTIVIGRSVQNRPIEVYRFGSGQKVRMMIFGIHGGDEGNTIALSPWQTN